MNEITADEKRATFAGILLAAAIVGLFVLACLTSGCHTISATAIAELEVMAATSQANVSDPTVATSDNAKRALWTDGRCAADVLLDVKGTPIPDFYLVNPWVRVAPVATPK